MSRSNSLDSRGAIPFLQKILIGIGGIIAESRSNSLDNWDKSTGLQKTLIGIVHIIASVFAVAGFSAAQSAMGAMSLYYMGWVTAAGTAITATKTVAAAAAAGSATIEGPQFACAAAIKLMDPHFKFEKNDISTPEAAAYAAFYAAVGGVELGLVGADVAYTAAAAAIGVFALNALMQLAATGCELGVVAVRRSRSGCQGSTALIESTSNKISSIFSSSLNSAKPKDNKEKLAPQRVKCKTF